MKLIFSVLLGLACTIPISSICQISADTFRVDNVTLEVHSPEGWKTTAVNDSMCWDSTWNYIAEFNVRQRYLAATIGVQVVFNNYTKFKPKDIRKAQKQFSFKRVKVGDWDGYSIEYFPKKIKGCKECGQEYLSVFSFPLSDWKTMNIVFSANGDTSTIRLLRIDFINFVDSLMQSNNIELEGFLLLNQKEFVSTSAVDTLGIGFLHFYHTSNFTAATLHSEADTMVAKRNYDYMLEQTDYYYSPFKVFVIAQEGHALSTASTRYLGEPNKQYGLNSNVALNYLNITCRRNITNIAGQPFSITFNGRVKVEDSIMIFYYQHALEIYANRIATMNSGSFKSRQDTKANTPFTPPPLKKKDSPINVSEPIKFKPLPKPK